MTNATINADTAQEFCVDRIRHFGAKADHNKTEALGLFIVLICCTLASPLFITLGPGPIFGKVIPSILSSMAAGCAVWLQQRKPQQLWTLYRTTQRRLENEEVGFRFLINEYENASDPGKVLAQRTAMICANANDLWVPLIPNPDKLIGSPHPEAVSQANSVGATT
jgi:hypothetical protein